LNGFSIGLIGIGRSTYAPAGRGVDIYWRPASTRPGQIEVVDSLIDLEGIRVDASGTAVVGAKLTRGTFTLDGRDASGPTGEHVTGRWTCG
jgi:hypothetical protein